MRISIIVPAYNEEKLLGRTLASIRDARQVFAARGWESELIVCDNNSSDQTAAIARAGEARVVFEPVNQIGRARNSGADAASGDWFLFIDADSCPSPALFAAVAERIESGRVLAGGAAIQLGQARPWIRAAAELWVLWSRLARHMAGSFIFCDAAAFWEVGGFDPGLFAAEELDLSRKLKRLARRRGRRIDIIVRPRLETSARKAELYSGRELLRFFLRAIFRPRRVLTSREACNLWYDGRR